MTEYLLIPSTGKGWALIGAIVGALFFGGGLLFMKSWQPKPQIEQKPPESRSFDSSQKDKEKGNEDTSKKNEELPEQIIPLSRKASEYGQVPEALSTPPASPQESPAPPVKPHDMLNNDGMSEQEENEQGISYTVRLASPTPTASSSSSSSSSSSVGSQTFADWQRARAFIEEANDPIDTVSIKFPSHMITEHHSAKEFKKWVSRLNDYMFVLRAGKIQDLSKVVRNAEMARGNLYDPTISGCALFAVKKQNWVIQLRGLGEYPTSILEIVEEIIQPALGEPKNIATCNELGCMKISQLVKVVHEGVSDNKWQSADAFVQMCTTDKAMREKKIDNLGAFLPCVAWEDLSNLGQSQKEKLSAEKNTFLKFFGGEVNQKIPDEKPSNQIINAFNTSSYKAVMRNFRKFVVESGLADAVKRSLFIDPPEIKKDS